MPGPPKSDDLKEFAMRLVDNGVLTLKGLESYGLFSPTTAWRLRHQWLANNHSLGIKAPRKPAGRPRLIDLEAQNFIRNQLDLHSDRTLAELQSDLDCNGHGKFTISTIGHCLKRMRLTRKTSEKIAYEQDDEDRAIYRARIAEYTEDQLVFIDESSVDWRAFHRRFGRSPEGMRVRKTYRFTRGPRWTVVPAISLDRGVFAIRMYEKFNGEGLFYYLKDTLLPLCQSYPQARSVIVMDNCPYHRIPEIRQLVEHYGCRLEYLPKYSPDYNPIEKVFGQMKSILKKEGQGGDIRFRIRRALSRVTREDIEGYYRFSSYVAREDERLRG